MSLKRVQRDIAPSPNGNPRKNPKLCAFRGPTKPNADLTRHSPTRPYAHTPIPHPFGCGYAALCLRGGTLHLGKPRWNSELFTVLANSTSMSTIVEFSSKFYVPDKQAGRVDFHRVSQGNHGRGPILIVLPAPKQDPAFASVRDQLLTSTPWEWQETGLTIILGMSAFVSTLLFLFAAGNS